MCESLFIGLVDGGTFFGPLHGSILVPLLMVLFSGLFRMAESVINICNFQANGNT
ncbi:MAG: hypothetical protein R6U46_01960 [Marinilabilia sp.]